MDETKLTAALPNLDIQIVHRDYPEENAEVIAIQFRAVRPFGTMHGLLGPSLLTGHPMVALWLVPMQAWSGLVQQAWAPWLKIFAPQLMPPRR